MCASNWRCTTPLWGRGGDITLFQKIFSDVPEVGVDTHGDVPEVGVDTHGDVTRGGDEESGDVPTQSPQGGGAPRIWTTHYFSICKTDQLKEYLRLDFNWYTTYAWTNYLSSNNISHYITIITAYYKKSFDTCILWLFGPKNVQNGIMESDVQVWRGW